MSLIIHDTQTRSKTFSTMYIADDLTSLVSVPDPFIIKTIPSLPMKTNNAIPENVGF